MVQPAVAADAGKGNLVSVDSLQKNLQNGDVLVVEATPGQAYAAKNIAGAVNVDVLVFGGREIPVAEMERRIQSCGVGGGKKIVIYDQGGRIRNPSAFSAHASAQPATLSDRADP